MALKPRTFRRVILLGSFVSIVLILAFGYFVIRPWQANRKIDSMLSDGIAAIEAEDHIGVVSNIGRYLRSGSPDPKYHLPYARSHLNYQASDGGHYRVSIASYRAYLKEFPEDLEASKELLPLFNTVGMHLEAVTLGERIRAKLNDSSADVLREEITARIALDNQDPKLPELFDALVAFDDAGFGDLFNYAQWHSANERGEEADAFLHARISNGDDSVDARLVYFWFNDSREGASDGEVALELASIIGLDPETIQWGQEPEFLVPETVHFLDRVLNITRRPDLSLAVRLASARINKDPVSMIWAARRLYWQRDFAELVELSSTDGKGFEVADVVGYQMLALRDQGNDEAVAAKLADLDNIKLDFRASAWTKLANALDLLDQSKVVEARPVIKEAINIYSVDPTFHLEMGNLHNLQGRMNLAVEEWITANDLANRSLGSVKWIEPYMEIVNAYTEAGRLLEGIEHVDYLVTIDNTNPVPVAVWLRSYASLARSNVIDRSTIQEVLTIFTQIFGTMPVESQALFAPQVATLYVAIDQAEDAKRTLAMGIAANTEPQIMLDILEVDQRYGLGVAEAAGIDARSMVLSTPDGALQYALNEYSNTENVEQALNVLEQGRAQAPDGDEYPWQLSRARLLDITNDKRAREALDALRAQRPDDIELLYTIAESNAYREDPSAVNALIDEIVAKTMTAEQVLPTRLRLAKAASIIAEKQTKAARQQSLEIVRAIVANEQQNVQARVLNAKLLAMRPDPSLSEGEQFEPDIPGAITEYIAISRLIAGAGGQQYMLQAIDLSYSINDDDQAQRYLIEFTDRYAYDHDAMLAIARRFENINDFDTASSIYSNIYRSSSTQEQAINSGLALANIYITQRDGRQIQSLLNDLKSQEEMSVGQLVTLASLHTKSGQKDTGDQLASSGSDYGLDEAESAMVYAQYAAIYISPEAFETSIAQVLELDPTNENAWERLLRHLIFEKRFDEAQPLAAQAQSLLPDSEVISSLVLHAQGEIESAADLIERGMIDADDELLVRAIERVDAFNAAKASQAPVSQLVETLVSMIDEFAGVNAPVLKFAIRELSIMPIPSELIAQQAGRVVRFMPGDPEVMRIAINANLQTNNPIEAIRLAKVWRANTNGSPIESDYMHAQALVLLENYSEAISTLNPYLRSAIEKPSLLLSRQIIFQHAQAELLDGRDPTVVAARIEPLLADNPEVRLQVWLNLAASTIQSADESRRWIELVTPMVVEEQGPTIANAWIASMERLRAWDTQSAQKAIDLLDTAIAQEPENLFYLGLLSRAHAAKARSFDQDPTQMSSGFLRAMGYSDTSAQLEPTNLSHLSMAARYATLANAFDQAEVRYRKLLESENPSNPFFASIRNNLGMVIEGQDSSEQELQEALAIVTQATDQFEVPQFWGTRGWIELAIARFSEAESAFMKVQSLDASSVEGAVGLAIAQSKLGDDRAADAQASFAHVLTLHRTGSISDELIERLKTQGNPDWAAQLN